MTLTIEDEIKILADKYANNLKNKVDSRIIEMKADNNAHHLIYNILGVSEKEGELIDIYQNKGRFLYKYAGSFLEEATKFCFKKAFPESGSLRIPNTQGAKPKTFEIDCLTEDKNAIEIKWRDATTDGDHIAKEHTRIKAIQGAGYIPVRVMFYYPNREQARKVQQILATLYQGVGGEYHAGDEAWHYVKKVTKINLKGILEKIADERTKSL